MSRTKSTKPRRQRSSALEASQAAANATAAGAGGPAAGGGGGYGSYGGGYGSPGGGYGGKSNMRGAASAAAAAAAENSLFVEVEGPGSWELDAEALLGPAGLDVPVHTLGSRCVILTFSVQLGCRVVL